MRILLAEDDAMIGRSLDRALRDAGMAVDWVRNGNDCSAAMRETAYGLLLLDLGLPDGSGLEVLRALRQQHSDTPTVIITARDDIATRVAGLDSGADDYVVKPFDFDELNARIRAVLRRHQGYASSTITAGAITLDLVSREATYGGSSVILPAKEFALMQALAERPGAILSRSQLEDRLYGWGSEVESNAIDVLIFYVRRKLGKDVIQNVRGVGWMIRASAS